VKIIDTELTSFIKYPKDGILTVWDRK
jgi:hypothetical protein